MSKKAYIGVDGVAREVTQLPIGIDGVARNILTGYIGVAGVARKCFESGVRWEKYSCTSTKTWTQNPASGGTRDTSINYGYDNNASAYTGYTFSKGSGFTGTGVERLMITTDTTLEEVQAWAEGKYHISQTGSFGSVDRIESVNSISPWDSDYLKVSVTKTNIAYANATTTYKKGATSYGTITAPEGELPESGTLVEGSATDSYCILKIGSTNYYYKKVS